MAKDELEHIDKENRGRNDRPHTGTATCCCNRCAMPGESTYEEWQRHVDTKIEAGRRGVDAIDDQLARCRDAMELLTELEGYASQLMPPRHEVLSPSKDEEWSAIPTGPPSPLLEAASEIEDDGPPSPLNIDESPLTSRRQTICAFPSGANIAKHHQTRPSVTSGAGTSFALNVTATSSFYSEQAISDQDDEQPLTLPPRLEVPVPRRASSTREAQVKSARLSKPFNEQWVAHSPDLAVSAYDLLTPRSAPATKSSFAVGHSQRHPQPQIGEQSPTPYDRTRDKPLPHVHRMYTPRTASTTELLGTLTPDLFPTSTLDSAAGSRASSIFHNRRKGIVALDSDDCDTSLDVSASGGNAHTTSSRHTFKWHSQRVGGMRMRSRRRNSKADELLGLSPGLGDENGGSARKDRSKMESQRSLLSSITRSGSVLSSRETVHEGGGLLEKKSGFSLLKLSKLRKAKNGGAGGAE